MLQHTYQYVKNLLINVALAIGLAVACTLSPSIVFSLFQFFRHLMKISENSGGMGRDRDNLVAFSLCYDLRHDGNSSDPFD